MDENALFLQALQASLKNEKVTWEDALMPEDWMNLFWIAEKHHVLPMIYEAVYNCPAAGKAEAGLFAPYRHKTMQMVMLQTMKTSDFLALYRKLEEAELRPIVVKGIICRALYPNPDSRISGDEDLLLPEGSFPRFHALMMENGLVCADEALDIKAAYEVPYRKKDGALYLEAHKMLFPSESEAYGDFNALFEQVWDRAIEEEIEGTAVRTMGYTDHLFYLICHAFKHLMHSGVGVRQVCDMALYANAYGSRMDWQWLLEQCRRIRADRFAAALFRIGEKYLTFDPVRAGYPAEWKDIAVDETPLLADLLDAGVYGGGSMSRMHSSNMTLQAVAAQKRGKKAGSGVMKSLFPSAKALSKRYPYLQKRPYLLPMAWVSRIWGYKKEMDADRDNDASESIRIGKQRVELMKEYGILDEGTANRSR